MLLTPDERNFHGDNFVKYYFLISKLGPKS